MIYSSALHNSYPCYKTQGRIEVNNTFLEELCTVVKYILTTKCKGTCGMEHGLLAHVPKTLHISYLTSQMIHHL